MIRRYFLKSILGLAAGGSLPAAIQASPSRIRMANPEQTVEELQAQLDRDLDLYGVSFKWLVPNRLGAVFEEYRICPALAMPGPPCRNYPDGYYRILPMRMLDGSELPEEWKLPKCLDEVGAGAIVTAKWMEVRKR